MAEGGVGGRVPVPVHGGGGEPTKRRGDNVIYLFRLPKTKCVSMFFFPYEELSACALSFSHRGDFKSVHFTDNSKDKANNEGRSDVDDVVEGRR